MRLCSHSQNVVEGEKTVYYEGKMLKYCNLIHYIKCLCSFDKASSVSGMYKLGFYTSYNMNISVVEVKHYREDLVMLAIKTIH